MKVAILRITQLLAAFLASSDLASGFTHSAPFISKQSFENVQQSNRVVCYASGGENESSAIDSFVSDIKLRFRIFQESQAAGENFKQSVASVLAGEYDKDEIRAKVEEMSKSAPCVMFTWEASPSCKKAVDAFEKAGANVKIIRLDDPWSEGNPMRAEIGKMVGQSSVPAIFVGGEYVGGFDSGPSEETPGILDMAFKGTLRDALEKAGAL
mmetsp:Transcript_31199/g.41284  ORF Transcript_31199/g.41284 Transcript_31199/m.41284 type:complete len:211 (-) Transcript_31199:293-925(-)|eukprot:CAMPEP_0117753064 /NCGR_PEP_ID=MMETSP0947-20121206/11996_1 /TAXON_ID=44440 /ORGANISM="Chattonella subsalsa, Strain CCMP2191" /LENGTH=210 /DNA_ID=CAMNT_0005571861 /DNA_START=104 /DNA_END=736 /DNA_ORIENTATION=+